MGRLDDLVISPTGIVFDPRTGETFSVNPTGRLLLEGLRDGFGVDALVRTLEQRFDAHGAELRRDVVAFVRQLQGEGLLSAEPE